MWFGLGKVNGVDFWTEGRGQGVIRQREVVAAHGDGERATLVTRNVWLAADGKQQLSDQRSYVFRSDGARRTIDVSVRLIAEPGPVAFGDTKEGALGIRVASTMRPDAKLGGVLVNSEGLSDADAYGRRARWCDMHGPVDNQVVGVAMLVHPTSFRAPNCWFVRPYGLLAVNPFGDHELSGQGDGSYTLPAGESLTIRARVILHLGDEKAAGIADAFDAYAREP
jgi:hypothetical protein